MGAVAERLWSPRTVVDADAAQARMQSFRCLLNHRAVAVGSGLDEPIAGQTCVKNAGCLYHRACDCGVGARRAAELGLGQEQRCHCVRRH